MKEKNDLNVGKISEAHKTVWCKSGRIKINSAGNAVPGIVAGFCERAVDYADRPQLNWLQHAPMVREVPRTCPAAFAAAPSEHRRNKEAKPPGRYCVRS